MFNLRMVATVPGRSVYLDSGWDGADGRLAAPVPQTGVPVETVWIADHRGRLTRLKRKALMEILVEVPAIVPRSSFWSAIYSLAIQDLGGGRSSLPYLVTPQRSQWCL